MISSNYLISLVFDIYLLRFVFLNWYLEVLLGAPFGPHLTFGAPFGARGGDLDSSLGVILGVLGRRVASSSQKTRITTDSLSPGVQREARLRNTLDICSTLRGPGSSNSQSARYLLHLAWPGRVNFTIRSLFTALGVAREAHIRNPLAIYNT